MYIRVKVTAGSKREYVDHVKEHEFHISVQEKAERNMANKRVRELLALFFKQPVGDFKLVSGHHSPVKMYSVKE